MSQPDRPNQLGVALQTAAGLLWLPQAAAIAWAVQGLLDGRGMAVVWPAALGVLVAGIVRAITDAWGGRLLYACARARITALRQQAVTALATRSPLDIDRAPSGLAASVLAEQAEAVLPYLLRYLPVQQRVLIVPLLIAAVVACYSWVAALVLLLAAPLIPLFMALVGWQAKAAAEAQWVQMGEMNAFLLDRLRGLTTLRALGAVELTSERLHASAQSLRQRTLRVLRIAFLSSAVLEFFSALGVALVAVYIGFHLLGYLGFGSWGKPLSLGEGLFVLLLAPAFFEPLRDLSSVWHDRAAGEAAMEALQRLAERGSPLPDAEALAAAIRGGGREQAATPQGTPRHAPALRLRNLDVRHAGSTQLVLQDLSLDIGAGEHVAVTGASGCGKSTLLAAVAGLLPLQEGSIRIGSEPSTERQQRIRIGWIGQQPHLFAGSVQDNVSLGRAGVDRAAVDAALDIAHLQRVEQARAGQLLGEAGRGISGGEAVRLALARVAADPSIGLILADEPTAHLDRDTAAEVTRSLLQLARGRTMLVATHDPLLAAAMQRQLSMTQLQSPRRPASLASQADDTRPSPGVPS